MNRKEPPTMKVIFALILIHALAVAAVLLPGQCAKADPHTDVLDCDSPLHALQCVAVLNRTTEVECQHTDKVLKCVRVTKVYDGDTLTVEIPGVHPIFGKKLGLRVNGIDTPERRPSKKKDEKLRQCEKKKALEAKALVEKLVHKGSLIELHNLQRGKYFRIVADVYVNGKPLSDYLKEAGLGYAYDGGTKIDVNWCKPLAGQLKKDTRSPAQVISQPE